MVYQTVVVTSSKPEGAPCTQFFDADEIGTQDARDSVAWLRDRGFEAVVYREKHRDGCPVRGSRRYL